MGLKLGLEDSIVNEVSSPQKWVSSPWGQGSIDPVGRLIVLPICNSSTSDQIQGSRWSIFYPPYFSRWFWCEMRNSKNWAQYDFHTRVAK